MTLWLLLAVVAFVVAIACVKRGEPAPRARHGAQMAIRTSMGASRARLIRQVLTESLVLAAAAGCSASCPARGSFRVCSR